MNDSYDEEFVDDPDASSNDDDDKRVPETRSIRDTLLDDQAKITDATLLQLATSDMSTTLVDDLMSRDIPTQLKAFMLAKAKGDLIRVIKLSQALGELEDTYIERALSTRDEETMGNLQRMIETTSNALSRTTDTVQQVMGDQEIKLTIDQSTNIYNDNTTTNNTNNFVSVLSDQNSRQKLRELTAKFLSPISTNQNEIVNSQVIDSDEQTEGESDA